MWILLIITSVVLITRGIINEVPGGSRCWSRSWRRILNIPGPLGSLAQSLPWSVTGHGEHFIFILIKRSGWGRPPWDPAGPSSPDPERCSAVRKALLLCSGKNQRQTSQFAWCYRGTTSVIQKWGGDRGWSSSLPSCVTFAKQADLSGLQFLPVESGTDVFPSSLKEMAHSWHSPVGIELMRHVHSHWKSWVCCRMVTWTEGLKWRRGCRWWWQWCWNSWQWWQW